MRFALQVFGGLAAVAIALFCVCAGATFLLQIPLHLAVGWAIYLGRVVPQLSPDPAAVITAVVCLGGVVVGGHVFSRWLYANTSDEPRVWPWRWTLRIVGLVVVMFVAGIAVTGLVHQTTWLANSPEPLLDAGYRITTTRSVSANNLRQIVLAAHNYADERQNTLPRSTFDAAGRPMHSWQTAILPFLEQDSLFRKIDQTKPWTHPANGPATQTQVRTFLNPIHDPLVSGPGVSHYAGNVHVVMGDRPKTFADFPQGTSNVILAGEAAGNFRAWGDPLNARDPRLGAGHPDGFGTKVGKTQFVTLDGSVRTFDPKELAEVAEMMSK